MASKSNADRYHRDKDKTPYTILKARHIYGIFILGHSLGKGFEYPLIKGNTVFYDEDNNVLNFETQCEFLKGMTYDLYIIQIPFLPERPKKPLEKMFRAFDQRYKVANDAKFLELTEDDDDDSGYNVIFRRLLYAASDEQLRGNLDLEDYAERMWTIQQAEKEDLEYELIEKRQQLDETKGRLAEAKDQLKEQQNQLSVAKDQLKEQQNQLAAMIKFSASLGASPDQIAAQLGITKAEVEKVINDLGK